MKKSIVFVLVLLAAIVLVSPAIVGRIAERTVDENVSWAAAGNGEVQITAAHYERGWFSSEGQHRIELRDGETLGMLRQFAGPMSADELPVLIINTRLDHGLIPVASMSRDAGSLVPGLGSAVSTMQVELPDGDVIDLPGTIHSEIALGGELESHFVLEAGTHGVDDAEVSWGGAKIDVTTNPKTGEITYKGDLGKLDLKAGPDRAMLAELRFSGRQQPTRYGINIGDVRLSLDGLAIGDPGYGSLAATTNDAAFRTRGGLKDVLFVASSELDGDRIDGTASVSSETVGLSPLGDLKFDMNFEIRGADAAALAALQRIAENSADGADPTNLYDAAEDDLKRLFARGFEFGADRIRMGLPQGEIVSSMHFAVAEENVDTFEWTSLLLGAEAKIDVSIPVDLVEMFGASNQQIAMAIGAGYLVRKGDAYVMQAEMRKGLMTINGAPMAIPPGLF